MARNGMDTHARIVEAAVRLFYGDGIRAVSMDAVAGAAGVTKRTLYYHFESKDDLITAALEAQDQPTLDTFARWFDETAGTPPEQIEGLFERLSASSQRPGWKGCGFTRTAAELANMPGHPALKAGATHKKNFERWLAERFSAAGYREPTVLARKVLVLLDGAVSVMMVHRDPAYIHVAGNVAGTLLRDAPRDLPQ
ncbi:MAG: TetR/AcrR family transcriptional regulator [Pseudomonadota bacterium]